MRVRVLSHFLHVPVALLAVAETLLSMLAAVLVVELRDPVAPVAWGEVFLFGAAGGTALASMGLYTSRQRARTAGLLMRAMAAHVLAMAAVAVITFFIPEVHPPPATLAAWAGLSCVLVSIARLAFLQLAGEDTLKRRVLVYGAGKRAQNVARLRRRADQRGFVVAGYIACRGEPVVVAPELLLDVAQRSLLETVEALRIDEIVVAMDDRRKAFPVSELLECRLAGIDVVDVVGFLERETGSVRLDVLHPSWMIFSNGFRRDPVRNLSKRGFDIVAALLLLAVTWPVMVITALAIVAEGRGPVLYRQRRVGLEGEIFEVLKFRSMRVDAERDGGAQWARAVDHRVTNVGRVIRKIRVDELPQVLNVLRGHMSFVGPRPERPEFVESLQERIPYYQERHCAKPGITGWAQLCYPYGASERDAAEKLQYDLYYVKNQTLLFDLLILLQTVEIVLFGKGGR